MSHLLNNSFNNKLSRALDNSAVSPFSASSQVNSTRRQFLKHAASAFVLVNTMPLQALTKTANNKKVVWVFLRGALDGMHTVLPTGDPNFETLRGPLLANIKDRLLPLKNGFSLHPQLPFLHSLYQQQEMSAVVAVANAYRERSHFDAQDQMESGLDQTSYKSGWLGRAMEQYSGQGLAIARSIPLGLRNEKINADTWYPSAFPEADESLLSQLQQLYMHDPKLHTSFESMLIQKANPAMQMQEKKRADFAYLAKQCGLLLAQNNTMQCAMLEMGGWDTHNNQAGRLARQFTLLDKGLQALKDSLQAEWINTLVVITTEFGRTALVNGTLGTDHGTASTMLMAGGALASFPARIKGANVFGKWPGLASHQLYEQRDLMPTSDIRYWLSEALKAHWQLNSMQLQRVFPDIA